LDAVHWIDISWKETKDSMIISCFRIAGFPVSGISQCEEVEDDLDDDIPLAQLCNMVRQGSELNYDQMDEIESSLPTEETYDLFFGHFLTNYCIFCHSFHWLQKCQKAIIF
jgi:hypothetical protein